MTFLRTSATGLAALAHAGSLTALLSEQMLFHTGRLPSRAEVTSWERSLPVLAGDLVEAGLGSVEVLVDYQLPLTSKRADVVLAGAHPRTGKTSFVVVELKQWSRALRSEDNQELVLVDGFPRGPLLHPVAQVRGYCEYLLDFNKALHGLGDLVTGAAYLHDATDESAVADLFAYPQDSHGRLFTGGRRAEFLNFLRERLSGEMSTTSFADLLLSGAAGPSKNLLALAVDEVQWREQFGLPGNQLRIVSIQANSVEGFFEACSQSHRFFYIASLEAYNWMCLIKEFEALINSTQASESQLQDFFERNPDFLRGNMYESIYPHVMLRRGEAGPLIPDFVLKPHNENALCDLLELKRPTARLVVGQRNRKRLSSALLEASAQLREYRDYFELPGNRKAIEEIYGLRFFRPRMTVVIGKRSDYFAYDLRKAEGDVPHLTITTYDDLLDRARSRLRRA